MAGSRTEKLGTIFKRVQGLLRSGALKDSDKPLWYDVYEAFPPRVPPAYERPEPQRVVPKILYPEDIIRVQFYKMYGNPDVADLQNERVKTTCQRFIDKYLELMKTDTPREQLFEAAASALKEQGIRLRSSEEVADSSSPTQGKLAEAAASASSTTPVALPSIASIFGTKTVHAGHEEEQDFIVEDEENKPSKL